MGKGLALSFKNKYNDLYKSYRKHAQAGFIKPGRIYGYEFNGNRIMPDHILPDQFAILASSKEYWRNDSSFDWVTSILKYLVASCNLRGVDSVAMPVIGSGCGKLPIPQLLVIHNQILSHAKFDIEICEFDPNR
jgi:hypothetical protein